MEIWSAFLLGLVGSLHCAGMCGPLVIAMPSPASATASFLANRAAYNLGRLCTYMALGVFFGLVGQTLALAGFQRTVSLAAGMAILAGLLFSAKLTAHHRMAQLVSILKARLGKLLHQRTMGAAFGLGTLNGLLPCGLVYAACAAAIASPGVAHSMLYMLTFGLGTVPMMLAVGLAGKKLQFALRLRVGQVIPICLVMVSMLLILRGLALGIPFLSPAGAESCCHP